MKPSPAHIAHLTHGLIVLDDGLSAAPERRGRIYSGPAEVLEVMEASALESGLAWVEAEHRAGRHLVIQLSYELGLIFQGLPLDLGGKPEGPARTEPLLRAFAVDGPQRVSAEAMRAHLAMRRALKEAQARSQPHADGPTALLDWRGMGMDAQKRFLSDVEQIRAAIGRGDTYQVNHTIELAGRWSEPAPNDAAGIVLFAALRERQPAAYSAYLPESPRSGPLLCHSPEAFVWGQLGSEVFARPMKGTAPKTTEAEGLRSDAKNRAENLMIVDLLRNDLGRVALPGSVSVPRMFDVEGVGELWQMTSTVRAEIGPGVSWSDLMRALHPCGSITGAPKRKTMEIIARLEQRERGAYCGSVGYLDPDGRFGMNVVIRSLVLDVQNHRCRLGLGAGITHDSVGEAEWQEVLSKGRFALGLPSPVGIFETLRVLEDGSFERLQAHLARLRGSAAALGIALTEPKLQVALTQARRQQTADGLLGRPCRLRIAVSPDGDVTAEISPLSDLPEADGRGERRVFWATDLLGPAATTVAGHPLLAHKTTHRALYDMGWREAERRGGVDALFENDAGEVTEGGRTSLFVLLGGRWLTPPLSSGVLPGIARQAWLDGELRRQGPIFGGRLMRLGEPATEARLTRAMVEEAEQLVVVNSLRGAMAVALAPAPGASSASASPGVPTIPVAP